MYHKGWPRFRTYIYSSFRQPNNQRLPSRQWCGAGVMLLSGCRVARPRLLHALYSTETRSATRGGTTSELLAYLFDCTAGTRWVRSIVWHAGGSTLASHTLAGTRARPPCGDARLRCSAQSRSGIPKSAPCLRARGAGGGSGAGPDPASHGETLGNLRRPLAR